MFFATLAFGVLQYPLDQNGVLGDPLCHQQNALWDTEPPHDTAAHQPLSETHRQVELQAAQAFKSKTNHNFFVTADRGK